MVFPDDTGLKILCVKESIREEMQFLGNIVIIKTNKYEPQNAESPD